jgi:hypothetical protein
LYERWFAALLRSMDSSHTNEALRIAPAEILVPVVREPKA